MLAASPLSVDPPLSLLTAMGNWRDDYYAALGVRDEREQANKSLYDTCTHFVIGVSLHNANENPPQQIPALPIAQQQPGP